MTMNSGSNDSNPLTNHHAPSLAERYGPPPGSSGTLLSNSTSPHMSNGPGFPSNTAACSSSFTAAPGPDPHAWMNDAAKLAYHRDLKNLALGNARIIYGSDRTRFFDISTTHFVLGNKVNYGTFLIITVDGTTKILRKELADCPLAATRALVAGLTNDVGILFTKFNVGDKFGGQQGGRNAAGKFELGMNSGSVDDTQDISRIYAPRGPRGNGHDGDRGGGRGNYRGGNEGWAPDDQDRKRHRQDLDLPY